MPWPGTWTDTPAPAECACALHLGYCTLIDMTGQGSSEDEEYARALDTLSSLISSKRRGDGQNWQHAIEFMKCYLERLGLEAELPQLSVIHVAGTKGKGSTCAMVESMLRACGYRTGLYTSPHLVDVRERIRINGMPVDRSVFLRNLWWCYRTLQDKASSGGASMAAYFRFLTLLGLKIFLEQQVNVAVLEVGIGGRLDATNCIRAPVACGVAPLGFDHMDLLGDTLPAIATEKAGIFKPGCPAFTVEQPPDALAALQAKADEVGAPLTVVRPWHSYANASSVALGLAGEHQKVNAALALALVGAWEAAAGAKAGGGEAAAMRAAQLAAGTIPSEYAAGLEAASWPGRGQVVHDFEATASVDGAAAAGTEGAADQALPRLSFFLDGAHTAESMATCGQWFADATAAAEAAAARQVAGQGGNAPITQRVLLFNCMQEREPQKLLAPLAQALAERHVAMHHALFVPPDSQYFKVGPPGGSTTNVTSSSAAPSEQPVDLSWQHSLRAVWEGLGPGASGSAKGQRAAATRPLPPAVALPPLPGAPTAEPVPRAAVLPSLRVTLDWLRRCVREAPSLRMHVLVTGSLYMVGDMLKLLGSPQQQQAGVQQQAQQRQQQSGSGVGEPAAPNGGLPRQ